MSTASLQMLLTRRSVVANKLGEPGPEPGELAQILAVAARVPDHKKLAPWRFMLFEGGARAEFGKVLAAACRQSEPEAGEGRLQTEAGRFLRAPVVIAVISSIVDNPAVPEWEQILSAGACCQNMLHAASALGYSAQWITEWYAYSEAVRAALGLAANERIAGFIYIGTAREQPTERDRPDLDEIVSRWPIDQ